MEQWRIKVIDERRSGKFTEAAFVFSIVVNIDHAKIAVSEVVCWL